MQFFNSVFTGGFSQCLSVNTLRNDKVAFSFPKGPRFSNLGPTVLDGTTKESTLTPQEGGTINGPVRSQSAINLKDKLARIKSGPAFYDIPSSLRTNSTNFGVGEKKASYIMDPKTPGPNRYEIKRIYESFENVNKVAKNSGRDLTIPTFGLPHRFYENNILVIEEQPLRP